MFFNNIYEVTREISPFYNEISTYCGKVSLSEIKIDQVHLFIKRFFKYCLLQKTSSGASSGASFRASLQPFVTKLLKSSTDLKLLFFITYIENSTLAAFYRDYSHNPEFQKPNIIHIFTDQPPRSNLFSLLGKTNETVVSGLFSGENYLLRLYKGIIENDRLKPYFEPYFESYEKEERESLNAYEKTVTRYFIEDYFPEVLQGAYYPKNVYEVENRVNPIATASDVAAVFNSLIEYINDSAQAKRSKPTYEDGVIMEGGKISFDPTLTAHKANEILERFMDSNKAKLGGFDAFQFQGIRLNTLPKAIVKLPNLKLISIKNSTGFNLPSWLGEVKSLTEITLNRNNLGGRIPLALCKLPNLYRIDLSENQLAGSIPTELGDLNNLVTLDLSKNQLTGIIPTELGELPDLEDLYLHCNKLTGPIPPELFDNNLSTLYLDHNQLTGRIPEELLDFIEEDHVVNLEGNRFDGDVPESSYDPTYKLPEGTYQIGPNGEFIPLT